jgi:molecular chaperone HscB
MPPMPNPPAPAASHFANFFDLLGLPASYALDAGALDRAYRALQAEVHPDRHANAGDAERRASMQWATRANEAYATLRDPLKRARYLLEIEGTPVNPEGGAPLPPAFLARQMELREALESAADARDAAALERLAAALAGERKALEAELAAQLAPGGARARAAELVRELMFFEKLGAEIGDALESTEDS